GRGVRLTPAGNALLPTVRRLFTSLDEATAYLEDLRGQRRGYLRVGSYTPHRFIVLVASVQKTFPWRFDLGRVCEFAGACKKSAQLRARCCCGARERTPYPAFTRLRSRATR